MGRMRQIAIAVAVLLVLCLGLLGCSRPDLEKKETGKVLYTVTDFRGNKLDFMEKPRRIISLNSSVDEVLVELVPTDRIAALSILADDPGISCLGKKAEQVKGRVQGTNLEQVLALKPDLVIAPDYDLNMLSGLKQAGVKTYVVHTPSDIPTTEAFIRHIGAAVGEPQKGDELALKMQKDLEAIRAKVDAAVPKDKRLKVLGLSFSGPLAQKGTFSDICHYAGVTNALAHIDVPFESTISQELMLKINPDIIITPSWDYSHKGDPNVFRQGILDDPLYRDINAVKNNKVVMLHDNYLYSTSQYIVEAVRELAAAAYPELFGKK